MVTLPRGENSDCTAGSTDRAWSTNTSVEQYTVVKKASAANVDAGETVTHTIIVSNNGRGALLP